MSRVTQQGESFQPRTGSLTAKASKLRHVLQLTSAGTPAGCPTHTATSRAAKQAGARLASIDAGGIPLRPAKINQLATALGLPVSREDAVEARIARIHAALALKR